MLLKRIRVRTKECKVPLSDILSYTCRKCLCAKPNNITNVESTSGEFRSLFAQGKLALQLDIYYLSSKILLFDYLGYTFLALRPFRTYTLQFMTEF